jgi:hypothetical protein
MAGGATIKVEGLDALKKKFKQIPEKVVKELDAELYAISEEYVDRAVVAAPVDTGFLKNGISATHGELNHEVISHATYSAYVEFGTITRVKIPAGLEEFAARFKGKGLRKTGGIYPHPFFFPQLPWAKTEIQKRSKEVIQKALK